MRVISIVNQKGGCGKTTTTVNLAACLAVDDARVLVVDLDPQAHSTLALGVDPDEISENLYEVLAESSGANRLADVIIEVGDNLDIAPSGIVLSALEQKLAAERVDSRTERLACALDSLPEDAYDFVLIDCPPNVGLLTFNALRASGEVIVPLETSRFAIHGVEKLLETIALLTERIGHNLTVRILPTLYDGRTKFARKTLGEIRELFKDMCFDTVIRLNIKLREAAGRGLPISSYARSANGTVDHAALAVEVEASAPLQSDAALGPDGMTTSPKEIVVKFRDPTASDVRIAGDFNGWVPDKGVRSLIESQGQSRVWTKILRLSPGTYQYRYLVDGEWREDPDNPEKTSSPVGGHNSVLTVR